MPYLMEHCQLLLTTHNGLLATLFLAGLVGSVSHCVGMCGPFVAAQSFNMPSTTKAQPLLQRLTGKALFPYHFGRMTSYILLGVIAALLSKQIIGTPLARWTSALFLSLAGLIFIISVFPLAKRPFRFIQTTHFKKLGNWLGSVAYRLFGTPTMSSRYGLGIMLGFLPCGLVFAAIMAVSTTGSPLTAAFAMMVFTLGTMPALMAVSFGSGTLKNLWPNFFKKAAQGIMILNGFNLFFLAAHTAL